MAGSIKELADYRLEKSKRNLELTNSTEGKRQTVLRG